LQKTNYLLLAVLILQNKFSTKVGYILRDRWRNLRDRFGSSKHLKKNTVCAIRSTRERLRAFHPQYVCTVFVSPKFWRPKGKWSDPRCKKPPYWFDMLPP